MSITIDMQVERLLPARLAEGDWLFLPGSTHVSVAALRAVRARQQTHQRRVVAVEVEGSGSPYASVRAPSAALLGFDVSGDRHSAFARDFMPRLPSMAVRSERGYLRPTVDALEALLRPDVRSSTPSSRPLRLVRCVEAASPTSTAAGVFTRAVATADPAVGAALDLPTALSGHDDANREGEVLLFLANLRSTDTSVALLLGGDSLPAGSPTWPEPSVTFHVASH